MLVFIIEIGGYIMERMSNKMIEEMNIYDFILLALKDADNTSNPYTPKAEKFREARNLMLEHRNQCLRKGISNLADHN